MLISEAAALLKISAREAPAMMLERVMLESARDFLRKSRVWRLAFKGPVVIGAATYALTLPTGALAHDIISAKLETSNTLIEYLRDAGRAYITSDKIIAGYGSQYITIEGNSKFTLIPDPILSEDIRLNVIMTLTRDATEIDDVLFEEYEEVLRDGALARLFEMPMESWSDVNLAMFHRNKYAAGTMAAKQRGEESGTPGVRTASFSW